MRVSHEDIFDAQPLRDNARDLTFVCDARLDNREELGAALGLDEDDLARMADSAMLFAAYKAWGDGCAERLVGDFVFAVWDGEARALTLCRDHMGQRHVFYHLGDGFIAFASERKGLWALADVPRRLPGEILARWLVEAGTVPFGRDFNPSPPDGLASVRGGTVVTVDANGAIRERRYWTPHAGPEHLNRDEAYYVDAYRRVLGEAVACRVRRAAAPVGLFMGGGFDSSAIAALAGPALAPAGRRLIAAASVSASDNNPHDARRWVEICSRHMPHLDVRYVAGEAPGALERLDRSFAASDGAIGAARFIADGLLSAVKSAGARVVMDGHGGDYTLNPRAKGFFVKGLRHGRLRLVISEWGALHRVQGRSLRGLLATEILPFCFPSLMRAVNRWRIGLAALGPTMPVAKAFMDQTARDGVRPPRARRASVRDSALRVLHGHQAAPAVGWAAAASAHGLEFTQPFHDKRVVELALAIPWEYRLRNGRERYLARMALKDLYPLEFQTRRDWNDSLEPDFMEMAARMRPTILAEIDRMERAGKLSTYLDFAKMRRMLTRAQPGKGGRPYRAATNQAIRAFLIGRYIEWFTGGNA